MNSENELFRSIYARYRPLLRIAARRGGIPYDELDDMVQETFASYYSHYPLDWPEPKMKAMLMTILRNRCSDYQRRQVRHPVTYMNPQHIEDGDLDSEDTEEKDTLEVLLEEQRYQDIVAVLQTMKPEWSDIFIKLMIEERPVEEVSAQLGISVDACRTRLSRARKYLREQLNGYRPMVMKRDMKDPDKMRERERKTARPSRAPDATGIPGNA